MGNRAGWAGSLLAPPGGDRAGNDFVPVSAFLELTPGRIRPESALWL